MGNPTNQDWVRLEILILRRACTILRKLFRKRWKQAQNTEWQDSPSSGNEFVSGLGNEVYQSFKGHLHRMTLEEGDVNNWDFTILTRILQQVDFKPDADFKSQFELENQRIEELISYRKKAIDYPTKSMGDDEFSNYWDQIEKILISFGESEKELDELKRSQSISEDDLRSLSGDESHPVDQVSILEARRLKDEAKTIMNNGGNLENVLNCLTSAIGLHNISDLELGALHASRSEAYLKKVDTISNPENRKQVIYLALKDAKQALYLRPAWGLAHYRVGKAYVELGKLKKASKYLDQALDLEPNMEEIKVANNTCKIKLVQLEDNFAPNLKTFQRMKSYPGGTGLSPEVKNRIELIFFQDDEDNILNDIYKAHKLRDGIDTKQNYKEAAILYRKGAKYRNAEGMYNLALLKLEGKGVKQDVKGGIDLLKRAGKLPHKFCQGNGLNFVSNVGVPESQFFLGLLAAEGIGFPPQRDSFSASVWYHEASENGHGPAAHNLAILLTKGQGINKDEKRALKLWKLAASRKVPEAMHALAIHHAKEWDTLEARRWLDSAIKEWTITNCPLHNCYDGVPDYDDFFWTPTEIQDFKKILDTIDMLKARYGLKEISRWESHSGFSPGRIMNQNMHMQYRLNRMLHGLDTEKEKIIEIEEYFVDLKPKPVIIPLPNAKIYVNSLRKQIRSQSSVGSGSGVIITDVTVVDADENNDDGRVSKASTSSDSTFISSLDSDSSAFIEIEP